VKSLTVTKTNLSVKVRLSKINRLIASSLTHLYLLTHSVAQSTIICIFYLIIFLKLVSYVQTNRWCRARFDPTRGDPSRGRKTSMGIIQEDKSGILRCKLVVVSRIFGLESEDSSLLAIF
jgi:hypothetical protein